MIDFELDEDQQLIQETVNAFANEVIRPAAHDADETGTIPSAIVEQAWELGLIPAFIPEEYGGHAHDSTGSAVTGTIVAEGLAEGDLAIAAHILAPRLVVDAVVHAGSEEQKREILPKYCGDAYVAGSAAVLEPRWDFDTGAMQTTAELQGGEYVVNGKKCFVPLATTSPYMILYAASGDGVVALVVPAGTPGVEIGEREKNMGVKGLETFEVTFNDCRLPESARLPGDASGLIRRARVAQSAMAVGVAKASLEYSIEYAKERDAFGVKIAQKQAIAFMLAEMAIEVDSARLLNWEAAWRLDQDEDAAREVALAAGYTADAVMSVTDNGIQVLGGHGFTRDHPVEMWARNGRGFSTFEALASV